MTISIGINEENLARVAGILDGLLTDELLLYLKTRKAHWNVEGPYFHNFHQLFEDQYEQLDEIIDDVAERTRALGHFAKVLIKIPSLEDEPGTEAMTNDNGPSLLAELLKDHERIIRKIREQVDPVANELRDAGTADFITGLMELHEKMAWMLRAHRF
jgi:starvation-inducible DNA-binding protein